MAERSFPTNGPRPGLSRRDFLRLGAVAGPAALMAGCGWDGGPLVRPRLAAISRLNDWVGEHVFLAGDRLAPTYAVAERSAQMPNYFISRETPVWRGAEPWMLTVAGRVRKPMRFTLAQLEALPRTTYTVKHHCVEGWTAIATWSGVPLRVLAALVEPTADARYLRVDSFDDGYMNGWDLASAMHPQTILAYAFNDRPLTPDHGAPLRLYSPIKLGYKLTKYVTALTFTRDRPTGYWEDRGYPWLGGV
jgi:DMSO/TMAO reductase YedYZ molybdopterin-dependent catalytic subunit